MADEKTQYEKASLRTLADGQAIAAFDFELDRAIENCLDINTDQGAVRKVTLTVCVKPNSDRSKAEVTYQAQSRLPPDAAGTEQFYLTRTADGAAAFVHTPTQLSFDDFAANENANAADVTRLKSSEAKNA